MTKTDQTKTIPLPPDLSYRYSDECRDAARDDVDGWMIYRDRTGYSLISPAGFEGHVRVPAAVQDAFRSWLREADEAVWRLWYADPAVA